MLFTVRWIVLYPKKNYDFRRVENLICVIKIQHIKNTWFWELFALVYAFWVVKIQIANFVGQF